MSRVDAITTNLRHALVHVEAGAESGGSSVLVEDGYTAQGTGNPFGVVLGELRTNRVHEGTDKGNLPSIAFNGTLIPDVLV